MAGGYVTRRMGAVGSMRLGLFDLEDGVEGVWQGRLSRGQETRGEYLVEDVGFANGHVRVQMSMTMLSNLEHCKY